MDGPEPPSTAPPAQAQTPTPEPEPESGSERAASRSINRSPSPPSFNFTQPAAAAPETAFFQNTDTSSHIATQRSIREIGLLINSRRRAAALGAYHKGLGGSTAYIDQDDSGTYDPSTKRRRAILPEPSKKRKRAIGAEPNEDGNPMPKKNNRLVGYASMITFKFTTKAGLDYLRSITPDPGDSSDEESFTDEDTDSGYGGSFPKTRRRVKKPDRLGASTREDGLTLEDLSYGHPQRRGCKSCFLSGNDECTLIDDPTEYPCEACEDAECDCEFIVPPEYKNICARCKAFKLGCSYEFDSGKNQEKCQNCADEDVACCAGPCEEKHFTRRIDSVIGRSTIERRELATRRELIPPPKERERAYVSCTQCRNEGLRCSLRDKKKEGPCKNCKNVDQECQFVYAPVRVPSPIRELVPGFQFKPKTRARNIKHHTPGSKEGEGAPLSYESTTRQLYSEIEKKVLRNNKRLENGSFLSKGKKPYESRRSRKKRLTGTEEDSPKLVGSTMGIPHIYLKTSFCHPIKFNYIPPPDFSPVRISSFRASSISTSSSRSSNDKKTLLIKPPNDPCDFCHNRFFGLTGLSDEPRPVEGYYYPDGSGFEEISGGFSELGIPCTKMCVKCTTDRINIMSCSQHRIRALKVGTEIDARIFVDTEWAKAVTALRDGDLEAGKLISEAKWCSICPMAAKCICSARQEDGSKGCGLMLCEKCDALMEQLFKGGVRSNPDIITAHIREMKIQSYRFAPPRADATFLTPEGELMVRLKQGMGQKIAISESPVIKEEAFSGYLTGFGEASSTKIVGPSSASKSPAKKDKGKGKDWNYFDEELRPKGWDKRGGKIQDREGSIDVDDEDIAELISMPVQKKNTKVKPEGGIEFGGALNHEAREEQEKRVAKVFGCQIIDLTGDDD